MEFYVEDMRVIYALSQTFIRWQQILQFPLFDACFWLKGVMPKKLFTPFVIQ
jgi:hypothetical protein